MGRPGLDRNRLQQIVDQVRRNTSDGDHEILYDQPIPHMRYLDWQAGARIDLDSGPTRAWAVLGVQGLAPYFFNFAPAFYVRDGGRVAGRIQGSYDLYLS
jgi:copper resistance protein B